jgi:hypothetical protein
MWTCSRNFNKSSNHSLKQKYKKTSHIRTKSKLIKNHLILTVKKNTLRKEEANSHHDGIIALFEP